MYLWRAMSEKEFADFNAGLTIESRCHLHQHANGYKMSKGICFFDNPTNAALWDNRRGVVVCLDLTPEEESEGWYPDYREGLLSGGDVLIKEYAVSSYSRDTARLVAYGFLEEAYHLRLWGEIPSMTIKCHFY